MKTSLSRKSYLLLFVIALMFVQTSFVAFAADEPPTIVDPFAAEEAPPTLTLPPAETTPEVEPEVTPEPTPVAETEPEVHAAAPAQTTVSVPIKTISKSGPEVLFIALASALMGAGYRRFKKNK